MFGMDYNQRRKKSSIHNILSPILDTAIQHRSGRSSEKILPVNPLQKTAHFLKWDKDTKSNFERLGTIRHYSGYRNQ